MVFNSDPFNNVSKMKIILPRIVYIIYAAARTAAKAVVIVF